MTTPFSARVRPLAPLAVLLLGGLITACSSPEAEDTADASVVVDSSVGDASDAGAPDIGKDTGPQNANGIKDGDETDVDCGGSSGKKCSPGSLCAGAQDCVSSSCTGGTCRTATITDGVANGSETDVDCGGPDAPACGAARKCAASTDCVSFVCNQGVCGAVLPTDGVKNGDETDIDCGGSTAPACTPTHVCLVGADCTSTLCSGGTCTVPNAHDQAKNGDETDIDCGGAIAPACTDGNGCGVGADCTSRVCTGSVCKAPTNTDGVKNGSETDVDCGGASGKKCGAGATCGVAVDCTDSICTASKCVAGTASDGVKNRTESDVDCGGALAPTCATGKVCAADTDCQGATCGAADPNGKRVCAGHPSCRPYYGGRTCGQGEVGAPGAAHEDCCTSYPVPSVTRVVNGNTQTAQLNKYEITAGRVRAWIDAIKAQYNGAPNIRAWVAAHPPAQLTVAQQNLLPQDNWNPADYTWAGLTRNFGLYGNLGSTNYIPAREPGVGSSGCYLGTVANSGFGHPTYYFPDAIQTGQIGSAARAFTQSQLDVKAMNCMTPVMFASLCAWDGGEMMTLPAWNAAWGNQAFPWGGAPSAYDHAAKITNWNPWNTTHYSNPKFRYEFPIPGDWGQTDQAFAIAAPGRFAGDVASVSRAGLMNNAVDSWMDMGGNHLEWAAQGNGAFLGWGGNSWEGHQYSGYANHGMQWAVDPADKYGKGTTRCMYWK